MDAVIPDGVLAHLRNLAEQQAIDPLRGGFTIEQYCEALAVSVYKARKDLRNMVRDGVVKPKTIGLDRIQAQSLGHLRPANTTVYFFVGKKP
jgi:hypothetical protein